MPPKGKGKAVIGGKGSSGKRKLDTVDEDKTGRKRRNPNVLQFFEDAADEVNDTDDSDFDDFDDDDFDKMFDDVPQVNNEPAKGIPLPFVPKEEEMTEEELDKMFEERYRSGSRFVTFAEDGDIENKRSFESNTYEASSSNDPIIWKVKCMVGREKHSAFCLMQKFADMKSLGTKLHIISAFAVDHVKGFIYIEADKQNDVNEACKGLCSIYCSRISVVSKNEISHLLSARSKCSGVSKGMWACVKSGTYKGDLAQVVDVNNARRRATVKLIPRLDLQALLAKFGGGSAPKKSAIPAPRLIHSSELEEFRPLIQCRRDRETGEVYEFLDGLMLKDGYLFKKLSLDSLNNIGLTPSEDEVLKFQSSGTYESKDLEWLSQLYGEQKRKRTTKALRGGEKGEGSSSSSMGNGFEMHDLVCFGRKDFGVVVGIEKDDYKILRDGPDGPVVVTVGLNELKTALTDTKFTALDQHKKTLAIADTVKVLEGPSKDRQGIVKQIYRGTIFLHDESIEENGGYFCAKSHMCEKVKLFEDAFNDKACQSEAFGFGDFPASPKSPLSPKKPWQSDSNRNFGRGDKDGMFSIGQALRIRVGPLKGYLCRVLAIRYSDITVKLDSQQRVLTVKCEHLSEVRSKISTLPTSDGPGSSSVQPFDLLGTQGSSGGWTDGAGTTGDGNGWNVGGASNSGNAWTAFPASGTAVDEDNTNAFGSVGNSQEKSTGPEIAGGAWGAKITTNQNSSSDSGWGQKKSSDFGNNEGGSTWGKALEVTTNKGNHGDSADWGTCGSDSQYKTNNWNETSAANAGSSWNKDAINKSEDVPSWARGSNNQEAEGGTTWETGGGSTWGKKEAVGGSSWGNKEADGGGSTWGKKEAEGGSTWGKKEGDGGGSTCGKKEGDGGGSTWGKKEGDEGVSPWGKRETDGGGSPWGKKEAGGGGSPWGKREAGGGGSTWAKKEGDGGGSTWGKKEGRGGSSWDKEADGGGSTWGKKETDGGGSTWGKKETDGGGPTWSKKDRGGSTWGNEKDADGRGSTWGGNGNGGSAWGQQEADRGSSWSKKESDGGSTWGKKEAGGGSTWKNNQDGGTAWGKAEAGSGSSWNNKQDGRSSWSKPSGGSWNDADGDQDGGWERQKSFEGGQGSGGRRGGGNRGGRDNFGGGRSYGRGRGGWSRESQDTTLDGSNSKWNDSQSAGWDKSGGKTSDWRNAQADGLENTGNPSNNSWSAGRNKGSSAEEESGRNESDWNKKSGGWNGGNVNDSNADNAAKPGDLGGLARGWDQKEGNQDSSWGKSNWQSSGSEKPSDSEKNGWGSKGGNPDSSWGKSNGQSSGSEKPSNSESSGWGSKGGNQDSSWGKSNWQSGGTEKPSDSENRGFGGNWRGERDGSDGGGFRGRGRGRGRSDGGGFGGRNNFEGRGGFGGGRRGGYGGRGQGRRDDSGDWRSGNAGGRSGGWTSEGGGWKDNAQSGGWKSQGSGWGQAGGVKTTSESDSGYAGPSTNQSDRGNSLGTGWSTKGSGGNAQGGGWNSATAGSSGNQSDSGNSQGTGWNAKESGGNAQGGGWNSAAAGSSGNQSDGGNSQGTGWNAKGSGGNAQSGGWN